MFEQDCKALCGGCKVSLKVFTEDHRQIGQCPSCGRSDTVDNIMRIVGEHAQEQIAQGLNKAIADGVRGSKYVSFKPAFRPQKSYRFISDLNVH